MKYLLISMFFLLQFTAFSQQKSCFDVARKGTLQEIKSMFTANSKIIDSINDRKSSMLILACYYNNNEVAKFLIENKVDLNYVSDSGTALMACIVKGNNEMAKYIIEKKANINLTDANGTTALIYAVNFKNIEMIKLLLDNKADKTKTDKNGKTAFEYAAFSNEQQIINLLK
ncbi:ankyrin repeat domain-containing protein [Flavobacterium sp.]|uniref:ankyrin repeat domain-containing protein n=1 Tax=Flavobacterium sp. TaxID=239 RepID=UPI0037510889